MNNFDFNIGNKSFPTVTLLRYGISFNQHCIAALGEPEFISIGLDRENKKLAIKAIAESSPFHYNFVNNEKKKRHLIISATKLHNEIIHLIGIKPLRNGIKLHARFDHDSKMLIVDLKQAAC